MLDIAVRIKGKTPLMCHRFTDEAQMQATRGTRSAIRNDASPAYDEAYAYVYRDENGVPGIPAPNMLRCIIDAGRWIKKGRSKLTTGKSSLIPAAISISPIFLTLGDLPWQVDTRPVRNPVSGGRILSHRPVFPEWELRFELELEESIITVADARELMDYAGAREGLGGYRPAVKGPFGKFTVDKWKVREA